MLEKVEPRKRRRVTSTDVAREAGVSQSVVSRAFSEDSSVAQATRARIFDVAKRLGYRQNRLARSLITSKSSIFALVTEDFANPLVHRFIASLMHILRSNDHHLLVFGTPPGDHIDSAIENALQYQVDGILVLSGSPSDSILAECHRSAVPVVILARDRGDAPATSVSCDNRYEAQRVANVLVDAGHERFAFVASRIRSLSFSLDREHGFCETILARGFDPAIVVNGESTYAGGYKAGIELLSRPDRPDAIFCSNDSMAIGVLDAARLEFGLEIPRDLSVVGFDDLPMAAWKGYDLTTVRQRIEEIVSTAAEILLDPNYLEQSAWMSRLVPGELVLRGSTRRKSAEDKASMTARRKSG
ncbi:MAG: LacI family DNA-binding transcriptional regulator [Salinarimonadaceae bacterium]|nr:MAG: LacI family DNA-binding transcriptional regulator [Salinarimonadaceae bacterium]